MYKTKDEEKRKRISLRAIHQKSDAAILGLLDGFLESALQFLLQLFLSMNRELEMDWLRGLFIFILHTHIYIILKFKLF